MGPSSGGSSSHPPREGASSAMAHRPALRVHTRRQTAEVDTQRVHTPHATRSASASGVARRVGSPAFGTMHDSPLGSPTHVRALSPTARAWSPSLRSQVLGRSAAYAAQSLVDAVVRTMSPASVQDMRYRQSLADEEPAGRPTDAPPEPPAPQALIVAPQARHGAVWLEMEHPRRPLRRPRARHGRQQRAQLREMCHSAMSCIRTLLHPREAVRTLYTNAKSQWLYWDEAFRDPATGQRSWHPPWLGAYVPLLIWLCISVCSSALVVLFHTHVFETLDALSRRLRELGIAGRIVMGAMIFLTTFPPLPLYSTLVVVSGFAFGMWQGFVVSYIAALVGAVTVFVLSRSLMRGWMIRVLSKSGGLRRVVHAIEKRPQLLFLVRLAPYPFNLLNTLLASSSTLTLRTYVLCTALPLFKLLVHTALGSSIQNFATFNGAEIPRVARIHHIAGITGLVLCIIVLIYIAWATQRAVDEIEDADDLEIESEKELSTDEETGASKSVSIAKGDTAYPLLDYAEVPVDPIAEMELAAESQHRRTWT